MKIRLMTFIAGSLLASGAFGTACAGRDADLGKKLVGYWQEDEEDSMVVEFAADGTAKFMPLDPEAMQGGYMSLKWTLNPGGKLKLEGVPGDDGEVTVRIEGDVMNFLEGDRVDATFRRLKELPAALKSIKPASVELLAAARDKALMVKMASDGRQVFMAHAVLEMEGAETADNPVYPKTGTSTEHFRKMASQPGSTLSAALLGGPGVPVAAKPDLIKADNVAWLILADAGEAPSALPFLLSRNVKAEKVGDLKGRIVDTLSDRPPFGKKAAIMVRKDGSVRILAQEELGKTWEAVLGDLPPDQAGRKYLQP